MKHFILSVPPNPEGMIHLYEKDYHYLVRVRRLRPGMCFNAQLPTGDETQVRVLSTADNILIGECVEKQGQTAPEGRSVPGVPIALFQALPKGAKMDLIIRQAAECGVSVVAPFESEYSAVHLKDDSPHKAGRWERIVREARQQSGSARETSIWPPCKLDTLLELWASHKERYERPTGILLHQEPLENGTLHGYLGNNPDFVVLAVGPEGGFSPKEVSLFMEAGFRPMIMGNTILRTETASLYGIAAIRTILLENEWWKLLPKG